VTKKAEEIIKAAKEAERAKKEKEEKERQENKKKEAAAAAAAAAAATSAAKSQTTASAAAGKSKPASGPAKKDSVDMSDPESLDDILDHFPHLASDLIASSDDEGDERSAFPAGARPVPHGGWPATAKVRTLDLFSYRFLANSLLV
jgi:membrane protein involved in colicin uptake